MNNKKIQITVLLCAVLICVALVICAVIISNNNEGDDPINNGNYTVRSKTVSYTHFNTVSTLSSYGDVSEEEFENYLKAANETLEYYHKLFDIYYEYANVNNIKTINQNAGKNAVKVDKELVDFLEYCKELYTLTDGKTNIMLGSVLKIWHDAREQAEGDFGYLNPEYLPTASELEAANAHTSIDSLIISTEKSTVYISDPNASIDVGAIAKGYAARKVAERLREMGADSMVLNAGGNIITIGLKPDGSKWVTGITNPDKTAENSLSCRVEIGATALVTSGNYERYFICDGVRYHHIIDPDTLMPANYFASVSIFTADSCLADALSTALFCMSYEDGLALIEKIDGVDVIWINHDGEIKTTGGIVMHNP